MAVRLRPLSKFGQPLALRPRQPAARSWQATGCLSSRRAYAGDSKLHPNPSVKANTDPASTPSQEHKDPSGGLAGVEASEKQNSTEGVKEEPKDPRADALPHVSEEAAAMSNVTGGSAPDVSQGTPVGEVVEGDKEAVKNLPKVMQDAMKNQKRSFSTSLRRPLEQQSHTQAAAQPPPTALTSEEPLTVRQLESGEHEINNATAMAIADGRLPNPIYARQQAQLRDTPGLKFAAPELPMPKGSNMRKDRYDDIVVQVIGLIMKDGKKALAQKHMSEVLTHLRTTPAPKPSGNRPLLPTAPPVDHLPLNPKLYLTLAIDSLAPLMRIKSIRGAAGGGVALQIPQPLLLRQRRRQAIMWIVEAANKKKGSTSGFGKRIAEEVVAVIEGRSSAWEKRNGIHRLGISGRSNLLPGGGRRR